LVPTSKISKWTMEKKIKSEFLFKGKRMANGTNNNKNFIPRKIRLLQCY
jgi:hypothetical protein